MKGQTEVKHEILENYLVPWLRKIKEVDSTVRYIDGFAGKGKYTTGEDGSPIIAMDVANRHIDTLTPKLQKYHCTFVEKDNENYNDLKQLVAEKQVECSPIITTECRNEAFSEFATDFLHTHGEDAEPSFIFIDPFGFSGVPFQLISDLINLRPTGIEVFITFMSGKMAQFMETEEHGIAISEILALDDWREKIDDTAGKDERARQFVRLFEQQLKDEAGVEYVWPFEMTEETKRQNCYYLVHATNHFDGFKLMKKIMFNAGAGEQFAYLGPDHYPFEAEQQTLKTFDAYDESKERIQALADTLHERFKGQTLKIREVMIKTYEETTLIDSHYKKALSHLEDESRIEMIRLPDEGGSKSYGYSEHDKVRFIEGLDAFL